MNTVEKMIQYMKEKDSSILLLNNTQINNTDLNVVVIKILSWLKLEQKRTLWISEGKKSHHKPLEIDMKYPWCANLCTLLEREPMFFNTFSIKNGKFDFSDSVTEEDRATIRELAYKNYNPQMHT